MINKSKLWFITLSSIVLVLAIYYIAIPSEDSLYVFEEYNTTNSNSNVSIEEESVLTAMRITKDEETLDAIQVQQDILLDSSKTIEEKNEAYETIKFLNNNKTLEEKLESTIEKSLELNSFVSISDNNIKVVIANKDKSLNLANNIISLVNTETDNLYYVTVKFE